MSATTVTRPASVAKTGQGWSWAHYLALIGVPILIWEAMTVIPWLLDGPAQITRYRPGHKTVDWYAARGFEGLAIVIAIAVAVYVVRGCRAARRILTFDLMFCLAGATQFWADAGVNFMNPAITISSNWVNVNATCGHMPLVVNPDCGRTPDPILFLFLLETFVPLGVAILFGRAVRRARIRRPGVSTAKLFWAVVAGGFGLALIEPFVIIPLHLWNYPGTPPSIGLGHGFRYPVWEIACFGLWFGVLAAVRIFKDDKGHTIAERGLQRHRPATRNAITLLALYTIFQGAIWGCASAPYWIVGLRQHQWPDQPAQLVNAMCDAPGWSNTRYGPCPGDPGYRMPVKNSLPGESP